MFEHNSEQNDAQANLEDLPGHKNEQNYTKANCDALPWGRIWALRRRMFFDVLEKSMLYGLAWIRTCNHIYIYILYLYPILYAATWIGR